MYIWSVAVVITWHQRQNIKPGFSNVDRHGRRSRDQTTDHTGNKVQQNVLLEIPWTENNTKPDTKLPSSDTYVQTLITLPVLWAGLGTRRFYFQDRKNLKFQDIFPDIWVTKTRFFCISGTYNFETFRAEAKITIWRHEVVYWLSSERKMTDLEWPLHAVLYDFNAKIWDNAAFFMSCVTDS